MSDSVRIQTGAKEPIEVMILDTSGEPITALANINVRIRRTSDGFFFDWADDTFKASPGTLDRVLSEVSATLDPGRYILNTAPHTGGFATASITNPTANDTYQVTVDQITGTNASNVPQIGEIKVGQYVDNLDATVSTRATAAALATVQADTDNIQTRLPTALHASGRMSAQVEGMNAGVITSLEAPALANIDVAVSTRSSHSAADVNTVLTAAHGTGSWTTATGFAVPGDAMALTPTERMTLAGVIDATLTTAHGAGSWAGVDWTATEREQIRGALGIVGTQATPAGGGALQTIRLELGEVYTIRGLRMGTTVIYDSTIGAEEVTAAAAAGIHPAIDIDASVVSSTVTLSRQ